MFVCLFSFGVSFIGGFTVVDSFSVYEAYFRWSVLEFTRTPLPLANLTLLNGAVKSPGIS